MYWPIGAPRIYAASAGPTPRERFVESDDDAESRETTEGSGSVINSPGAVSEEDLNDALLSPTTPITPITPTVKPVESESARAPAATSSNGLLSPLEAPKLPEKDPIIALRVSRTGNLFAVITTTSLTIWQTKPTAILAVVVRSHTSLNTYGPNVSLLVRPDSAIFVVQTSFGYLITYSLASDPEAQVYKPHFEGHSNVQARRQSNFSSGRYGGDRILWGAGEGGGVREVSIRFRMVIKVDAGISKALALDDELVVATQKPAAVQCIRWTPDSRGNQTSTELLSRMGWLPKKTNVVEMIHDRPMNMSTWVTKDGKAYAVQRLPPPTEPDAPKKLFRGYCFHTPTSKDDMACRVAINARFSLMAVGCVDGTIQTYVVKDYAGNIPPSHTQKLSVSQASSGRLTCLSYSPDGYCLFAGYEKGWAMWSVFGKPGATSFSADSRISGEFAESWLTGVRECAWLGQGAELLLIGQADDRIWVLDMARSAVTGCYSSANLSRTLLLTKTGIMVYRGYDLPDLTTISADVSLWHNAQIPSSYLVDQWPMRVSVISPDGRYVAVAGRRGLAHYSMTSGRWKTFVNEAMENSFVVRGGMCWYQHILVAAVEAGDSYELRLFSREAALDSNLMLHVEQLPSPVVLIAPSGEDSLLVYTYDNTLYHYLFTATGNGVKLVQVGQIAFHGLVRSPARVRGLSWILPDEQILDGDPSQDVSCATVLFLVDGKLVLLQPSLNEHKSLKYDMRVIAQSVEFYVLTRDQPLIHPPVPMSTPNSETAPTSHAAHTLQDSLWMFDGDVMKVWTDVNDVLRSAPAELGRELPPTVSVPIDFYPLSVLLAKGILLGVEPDLVQRRDMNFAFFKFTIRTHLFIPQLLKFHLARYDSSAALHLAHQYQGLEYFAHALEVLLHDVLDEEVDTSPPPETALLPGVLSFLSSFPQYLDIVVQCTRKTELRSWKTLFEHLPPPQDLFEEALRRGSLKTAGGYLLILHTFEEGSDLSSSSEQLVRLLGRASDEGDWELCKELARFLVALDESGATLRTALEMVNLRTPQNSHDGRGAGGGFMFDHERARLQVPARMSKRTTGSGSDRSGSDTDAASTTASSSVVSEDENGDEGSMRGSSRGRDSNAQGVDYFTGVFR